ncbi:uncharacterized protein F5147DRAFT_800738 [Suillus discolor]|uniref:Heterokaryon incompatibility domain-containing protein n=1 Tax=Suillus discolor TaxID=1912936 RepID=A0A9P7JZU4_9AGAM|nr:uncharacterized protein F5147DRAFT_800738 [Suillus discolor]KAG2118688.1 hypothetical protein F5147DRAFT_800738 [Suillus discolor]
MLWKEALLDAQKVTELNPSSYLGYSLKHAALHGAQRYDEAVQAYQDMLSKLNAPDNETQIIDAQLDNAPLRVLDTTTGLLCDREMQICTFKTSTEYKELVSSTIMHRDIQMKRIEEVAMSYFRYVMLSHRWEDGEPLLQDIQGKVIYELDPVGDIKKLQSFCKTTRDLGYHWAWSDTCCIDKNIDVKLQASLKSMFACRILLPSSKPGALARSAWNTRGWTVQEFLVSKVIIFYQKDWTLYLDDRTPNHKDSVAIMQELEDVTGIDRRAVVAFRPGMRDAREKLQWASTCITTLQEDIAYSLFGVFGIRLHVDYTEKKQNALGRLLQEIIAQSGDITALDWVGKSSEFNSCLPADITLYEAPPRKLSSPSEEEIQSSVSSLRDDTQSVDNWSVPESPLCNSPVAQTGSIYSDLDSRALRLIVCLGQPFSAFLLARQRNGEFKRIASEHDIIARVKDMASISYLMDMRTLEVL